MLFNSLDFIFGFLPAMLVGYFLLGRFAPRLAAPFVAAGSLAFYAWWDLRFLPLLLASIAVNFACARAMARLRPPVARRLLAAGIVVNLLYLGFFKYSAFAAATIVELGGPALPSYAGELPLGISFFTFTQIAFLVDTWRSGAKDYDVTRYGLFVTFFPHLMAGPLLHHKDMMPQFSNPAMARPDWRLIAMGTVLFILGLAKKTLIADPLGVRADAVFAAAGSHPLQFLEAWYGALAYTGQIYFDFSGYSEMALGLAALMGIRMPVNFNSPYKAHSIIDFWRRWHISLSAFLRDYLYIPLGGNRNGPMRRHLNLMATMVLGGLWHGAGWTFVAWGAFHGAALMVNHAWHAVTGRRESRTRLGRLLCWGVTMVAVAVGWVFFRAPSMAVALDMIGAMIAVHPVQLPPAYGGGLVGGMLSTLGIGFADNPAFPGLGGLALVLVPLAAAAVLPNALEIVGWWGKPAAGGRVLALLAWRPAPIWTVATALCATVAVLSLGRVSKFLYFQF